MVPTLLIYRGFTKTLGLVDIVATLVAFWIIRTEDLLGVKVVPVEKFPEIHRWVKKLSGNDVIKKCTPPEDEHLAYIRARMDKLNIKSA
uniref:GST16 n=1 Tax=Capsella rubella TaxID=81985 RepID=B2BXW8_9BRAS|nr:GST16 [Capsella rubella]